MKTTILLLWLWVCTAACEPLRAAIQRRSDRPGIYASDYSRGYRPYTYVALPLHAPVPVLHVLSPVPLYRPNRGITRQAPRPPDHPGIYASSMSHLWYAPPPQPLHQAVESAPAPEILYARPKPGGGFMYSKKPAKKRPPVQPSEPFIIRIHKYRIIRDP